MLTNSKDHDNLDKRSVAVCKKGGIRVKSPTVILHDRRFAVHKLVSHLLVACVWFLASYTAHAGIITLTANLDAVQVVPGVGSPSTGTGFAIVTFDTVLQTITTDLSWEGLSGPVDRSHLHNGPAGSPTDLIFEHEVISIDTPLRTIPCTFSVAGYQMCAPATASLHDVFDPFAQDGILFAPILNLALADGLFIDVHTELYPGGEIRGQLEVASEPASTGLVVLGAALLLGLRNRDRRVSGCAALKQRV
jgi:hypothetical protein